MRQRSLRFESLERRLLLAGDVNVSLSRGTLSVTGDGADNQIAIEYVAPNHYRVTGSDTTLKGGTDSIEVGNVNSIRVNMREGNNRVEIRGTVGQSFMVTRDLRIQSGRGDDVIVVERADIGGQLRISTLGGDNQVAIVRTNVTGNLSVSTGNGAADLIAVAGVNARNMSLNGGNSGRRAASGYSDIVLTGSTIAGTLTIRTGIGNDLVGVGDNAGLIADIEDRIGTMLGDSAFSLEDVAGRVTVAGSASITTSRGDDEVWVEGLDALAISRGGFTINAGSGDNNVGILNSTIVRNISITAGSGNDNVGLVDVLGAANITVRTGHGTLDRIGVAGVQATNITLDGGNLGRRSQWGSSEIGITASTVANNLTIRTGIGEDRVAVGNHPDLADLLQRWGFDTLEGDVHVGNSVRITTNAGDDIVWIYGLTGSANLTINTGRGDDQVEIVESSITGNIRIDTGDLRRGQGTGGYHVGLLRVTAGNLTVNNRLGTGHVGIAESSFADVMLTGSQSARTGFGSSWMAITNSKMTNLTIRQGQIPDGLIIGDHPHVINYFRLVDPFADDEAEDEWFDYKMDTVEVDGAVRIDINTTGRVAYDDVVRLSHLRADVAARQHRIRQRHAHHRRTDGHPK
jgi:large repetitive protein